MRLGSTAIVLQALFIIVFFYVHRQSARDKIKMFFSGTMKQIQLHHLFLVLVVAIQIAPLLFITLPPGCDTSMHGYITRLIINNNGIPHSYKPILPVNYFGSYSAGYHLLTAFFSGFEVSLLRYSINLTTIVVYPLTLLGFVFLLRQFFTEKVAIYTALVYYGINRTFIPTVFWGGNPTILSVAFCLFGAGLMLYAINSKSRLLLFCSSLCIAAIALVHAIPAIILVYLLPIGYVIVFFRSSNRKWILKNSGILLLLVILLLSPFLLHFRNENSPQLLLKIRNWQNDMMHHQLNGNLIHDLPSAWVQLLDRTGIPVFVISVISLLAIAFYKRFRTVLISLLFTVVIYLMVLNSAYWILPESALLYPERVLFFMIICWSFPFGCLLTMLEEGKKEITLFNRKLKLQAIVLVLPIYLSFENIVNQDLGLAMNKSIEFNRGTQNAIDWINAKVEPGAMFISTYAGTGMWLPAFTNHPTLGCHLHFIHEVTHVLDSMRASNAATYYFVTHNDSLQHNDIINRIDNKTKVFANNEVQIYRDSIK